MPVIRRKLASSPPRPTRLVSTPIKRPQPQVPQTVSQPQQSRPEGQRAMGVKDAARYLGTSAWQVRQWKKQGFLKAFRYLGVGKPKDMFAVEVLDALLERSKEAVA